MASCLRSSVPNGERGDKFGIHRYCDHRKAVLAVEIPPNNSHLINSSAAAAAAVANGYHRRLQLVHTRSSAIMEAISVGKHVEIKRSDGRIHSAVISDVNKGQRSVTVEWFEKGETKGKEIDIASLIAYNPQLVSSGVPPAAPAPLNETAINVNSSKITTRRSAAPALAAVSNGPVATSSSGVVQSPQQQQRISVASSQPAVTGKAQGRTRAAQPLNMTAVAHEELNSTTIYEAPPVPQMSNVRSNGNLTATATVAPIQHSQQQHGSPPGDTSILGNAVNNNGKRRSTVQKIEELEKNREERRAQLEEAKKRQDYIKSIDPGNPNWQFMSMIRDYQAQIDFRPLKVTDPVLDNRICVSVRKRPMNKKELTRKEIEVITIPNRDHVIVHQPQQKVDLTKYLENVKFRFDYSFDENTSNEMVYKFTAQPLVKTVFDQGFATCFAYGQTGSGKTHTMGGDFTGKVQDCARGIYAMTARDVFKLATSKEYKNQNLIIGCSFFEIYGGKAYDLLCNRAKLRVLEDGKKEVNIVGLQEVQVHNEQDVLNVIKRGSDIRTAGQTAVNNNSSRSHAIFQIILRKKEGNLRKLFGKFSLIDLAGNERGVDTMSSDRQTRMEGAEINKSLLALKECIRAMGRNSTHIPFRASKLTMVLRDSFVGVNSRTCMIAMISPGMNSCEHTLNTLRYADRVKELGCDEGNASPPLNDADLMLEEGDVLDESASDLALLRTANGDEFDDEDFKFQMTVTNLHDAEDRVIDDNQALIASFKAASKEAERLLRICEPVDYDLETYAREMAKFLGAERRRIDEAQVNVDKLQKELRKEDEVRLQMQQKAKTPKKR